LFAHNVDHEVRVGWNLKRHGFSGREVYLFDFWFPGCPIATRVRVRVRFFRFGLKSARFGHVSTLGARADIKCATTDCTASKACV
jgi:hypothetical protein